MKSILTAILIIMLTGASAANADPLTSFHSRGSCTEWTTGLLVDADRAQARVDTEAGPGRFPVLRAGANALVYVFVENCDTSIDGGPPSHSVVSGSGVFIDPTASDCESYDFAWGNSADDEFYRDMVELGWRMELMPTTTLAQAGTSLEAMVPSAITPWSMTAVTSGTAPLFAPLDDVHCHVGPRGLVRGTFGHQLSAGAGAGDLRLGDGELWHDLDAEPLPVTPGLQFTFTWDGTTELVE